MEPFGNAQGTRFSLVTRSARGTQRLGRAIGERLQPGDVVLLEGELGSGKTCLTQGIAAGLGVEDVPTSPTFVLVNEYEGRLRLYHIDLYRIQGPAEAFDLGLDDILFGSGVCVVEWAERGGEALPSEHLLVRLHHGGGNQRYIEFEACGERYEQLLSAVAATQRGRR